jgi:uncharacterized protein YukE
MAGNPLVATGAAEDESALDGAGIFQDFWDAGDACLDGNWTEGLVNGVIGAAGVAEFVADPIAGLASAGVGWLIEHVSFLREPLDWVVGDQAALDDMAGTWENISAEMDAVSDDLTKDVEGYAPGWRGDGAEAYRAFAKDRADTYAGVAKGAKAMSTLVGMCTTILGVVRTIIRDLIAECVAKLISIACRYPGPAVVAGAIAEGVPTAVKYAEKAMEWINKLVRAFDKAKGLFKRLTAIFAKAKTALTPKALKKLGGGGKDLATGAGKEFDFAQSVSKHWDDAPKSVGDVLEEGGKKVTADFKDEFQKEYAKEKWKGRAEKVDDFLGGDEEEPETLTRAQPPIFEQPGGNRISGSLW